MRDDRPTGGRRGPLDVDRILDAAAALIETDDAVAFSMRRLAESLDVTPMALYKWFDNRAALLDALAARLFDDVELPFSDDGTWTDRMHEVATILRGHLRHGRALLRLVEDRRAMDVLMARTADRVLLLLAEAGYPPDEAVERFRVFFWSIVGFVVRVDAGPPLPANTDGGNELAHAVATLPTGSLPSLSAVLPAFGPVDVDALFTATVRTIVVGLAAEAPRAVDVGVSPRGTRRAPLGPRR